MEKAFEACDVACDAEQLHEASGKRNITELHQYCLHNNMMGECYGPTDETSVSLFGS